MQLAESRSGIGHRSEHGEAPRHQRRQNREAQLRSAHGDDEEGYRRAHNDDVAKAGRQNERRIELALEGGAAAGEPVEVVNHSSLEPETDDFAPPGEAFDDSGRQGGAALLDAFAQPA